MPSLPATPDCRGPMSTMPGRFRCCRRCAPQSAGWRYRSPVSRAVRDDQRGSAGSRRRARPGPRDTVRARRPGRRRGGDHHQPRRSRRRCRPGPRVLLRRSRGGRGRRGGLTGIVCAGVDGVLTARRTRVRTPRARRRRIRAAVGGALGRRCAWRHRAGIGSDIDDPRGLVEQLLESARQHRLPDHAPSRALRVLENAAHVDAIIAVSAGLSSIADSGSLRGQSCRAGAVGTQSSSEARSPATRCDRLPPWCVRRGWPRSTRSCTRPGPTNRRLAQRNAADEHAAPSMLARQPGTGSGPLREQESDRSGVRRSNPRPAGRIAGRRWA